VGREGVVAVVAAGIVVGDGALVVAGTVVDVSGELAIETEVECARDGGCTGAGRGVDDD
jgi:hypothetical protein